MKDEKIHPKQLEQSVMETYQDVGLNNRLREIRFSQTPKKATLQDLATACYHIAPGITAATISRYENGKKDKHGNLKGVMPRYDIMFCIALYLGVTIEDIWDGITQWVGSPTQPIKRSRRDLTR